MYRVLLAKKSGFFAGLFDLPLAVLPGELAPPVGADYKTIQAHNGTQGLDGLSDEKALVLPDHIEVDELDHPFDFIFNMKSCAFFSATKRTLNLIKDMLLVRSQLFLASVPF